MSKVGEFVFMRGFVLLPFFVHSVNLALVLERRWVPYVLNRELIFWLIAGSGTLLVESIRSLRSRRRRRWADRCLLWAVLSPSYLLVFYALAFRPLEGALTEIASPLSVFVVLVFAAGLTNNVLGFLCAERKW